LELGISGTICPSWPQTVILLISASQGTRDKIQDCRYEPWVPSCHTYVFMPAPPSGCCVLPALLSLWG
jgi:hypothetical protein